MEDQGVWWDGPTHGFAETSFPRTQGAAVEAPSASIWNDASTLSFGLLRSTRKSGEIIQVEIKQFTSTEDTS